MAYSADPEIQQWPQVRARQFLKSTFFKPPPLNKLEIILNTAIKAIPSSHSQSFEPFDAKLEISSERSVRWHECRILEAKLCLLKPFGCLRSPVAIILDKPAWNGTLSEPASSTGPHYLPYGIREIGLDSDESLIWPFDLRQPIERKSTEAPTSLTKRELSALITSRRR